MCKISDSGNAGKFVLYFHHAILNKGSYFYDIERNRRAAAQNAPGPHQYDRRARLLCLGQRRTVIHLPRVCRPHEPGGQGELSFHLPPRPVRCAGQKPHRPELQDKSGGRLRRAQASHGAARFRLRRRTSARNILSNGHKRACLGGPLSDPPCPRALRRALQGKRRRASGRRQRGFLLRALRHLPGQARKGRPSLQRGGKGISQSGRGLHRRLSRTRLPLPSV